jgi:hypothetical protein
MCSRKQLSITQAFDEVFEEGIGSGAGSSIGFGKLDEGD